jgi:hypothetical protein
MVRQGGFMLRQGGIMLRQGGFMLIQGGTILLQDEINYIKTNELSSVCNMCMLVIGFFGSGEKNQFRT